MILYLAKLGPKNDMWTDSAVFYMVIMLHGSDIMKDILQTTFGELEDTEHFLSSTVVTV